MKKSIKKNYIYNLMYQILLVILPLITTPYISRILGSENIGIYSFTSSIVAYFILFGSLGVALYGQREIAFFQENKIKRSEIFWQVNIIKWFAMIISIAAYIFTFCLSGEYTIYYQILILELIANMLDISWYYQGLEDFKTTVIRNMIVKALCIACIFLFVRTPNDLPLYFIIYSVSNIFGNLTLWIKLPRLLDKPKIKVKELKKHIKPILLMFLPQITIQIYTVLDRTMLGFILNDMHQVGIYEQSQKIVKLSLTVVGALGTVMIPRIANLYAKNKIEDISKNLYNSFHLVFLIGLPIMFGIMAIAANLIPWFLGESFTEAIPILQIASLLVLAIGLSNITGMQCLIPINRQKDFTISVLAGSIINFVGNLLLIPYFKAIGAIISSVLAEFTVTFIQLWKVKKIIEPKIAFQPFFKCFLASFIMFIAVFLLGTYFSPSLISSCILIITGIIVYGILIIVLKEPFVFYGLSWLKKIIGGKK